MHGWENTDESFEFARLHAREKEKFK